MTSFQAIIFDLDDTLYPEQSFVFSGYDAVARFAEAQWGLEKSTTVQELRASFFAGNRADTLGTWLDSRQLDQANLPALIDTYRNHTPKIELFDAMRDLLAELSVDNRLGLISDGYLSTQTRKFTALEIDSFFSAVVFSDQWGRKFWKPSERPYRHCLTELQASAHQAVYVGDNPTKDFVTAKALGMRTIRVRRADGIYRELEPTSPAHAADATVTSTFDLRNALLGSNPQPES